MKLRAIVPVMAALVVVLAGCGGGGGGSSPLTPTAAIQQRSAAQVQSVLHEDVDAVMEFYSAAYTGPNGETKDEVRGLWAQIFQQDDFLSHQTISDTFTIAPSGVAVVQEGSYQFVVKDRQTGNQGMFAVTDGMTDWVKEGGSWRILTERGGELVQIANTLRHH